MATLERRVLDRGPRPRSDPSAMRHEVRNIPPAPRRLRWRPLLAHRWPMCALGAVPTVIGTLIAWAMFLQSGGKFAMGPTLDRGPVHHAVGVVTQLAAPVRIEGELRQQATYTVVWDHRNANGMSFVPAGRHALGDRVDVELLVADPNVNRIVGGMLHIDRQWLHARFWLVALTVPGGLILLGWLAAVLQLRRVLMHGDVSPGLVHRVVPVRLVLPEMLRVDYTFRDHHAITRHNRHWVRRHGELGARLLEQSESGRYEEMPVLHDRRLPQWNRMLLPQDFLRAPPLDVVVPDGTA